MAKSAEYYLQDHKPARELGRLALRGGVVSVLGGYGNVVLQLVATIVLARLLTPDDFGVVAIITVLTSFAPYLIDFGVGDATTQRKRVTQDQVSTLFWLSTGIGFAIAAALALCGPLIASLYHDPRLKSVALYSALTLALSGMAGQHLALLRRTMQFAAVAKVQFLGTLAGVAVGILGAMCGLGYGALVLRQIVTSACVTAGAWLACAWRPGRPIVDSEVKAMVRFGMNVVGFSAVYTLAKAADRIILGLFYGPSTVGYYQNAFTLYDYSIFLVLAQLHNVASPALGKLQSDHAALSQKYEAALSALAFFVMPAAAILSVTAQDVPALLLGEKWRPAGVLLSIIALRGIFQAVEGSQGWLHLSLGKPDRWKNWGVLTAIVQVAAILAGLRFGPRGVAAATVVACALIAVPSIVYAGRPGGIGARLVMRAVGRQLVGTIFALAGGHMLQAGWILRGIALEQFSSLFRIVLSASFCISVYLVIVVGLLRLTAPITLAGQIVRDHLPAWPFPRTNSGS